MLLQAVHYGVNAAIMTLSRALCYAALPALLALGVTGCLNPPDYPETPSIEFKGITKQRMTGPNGTADFDRVVVSVDYKDGDGDLGLRETELQPPYNTNNPTAASTRRPSAVCRSKTTTISLMMWCFRPMSRATMAATPS
jgi:hypothetical protein